MLTILAIRLYLFSDLNFYCVLFLGIYCVSDEVEAGNENQYNSRFLQYLPNTYGSYYTLNYGYKQPIKFQGSVGFELNRIMNKRNPLSPTVTRLPGVTNLPINTGVLYPNFGPAYPSIPTAEALKAFLTPNYTGTAESISEKYHMGNNTAFSQDDSTNIPSLGLAEVTLLKQEIDDKNLNDQQVKDLIEQRYSNYSNEFKIDLLESLGISSPSLDESSESPVLVIDDNELLNTDLLDEIRSQEILLNIWEQLVNLQLNGRRF